MPQELRKVSVEHPLKFPRLMHRQDCRVCNRRRIKCDRSLPSCKKCLIRKLDCTGYYQNLKWDQGVASRGKYAGQAAPISLKRPSRNTKYDILSQEHPKLTPGASQDIDALPKTVMLLSRISSNKSDSGSDDKCEEPLGIDRHNGTGISSSWTQILNIYQDPHVRRLIHYYDHHVATTFVWIDTPDDRWRKDVLPLAQASPSLLFAILALASAHLSSKLPPNQPSATQLSTQSIRYRERSLHLLAQQLEDEAQKCCSRSSVPSILATIYILCNLENGTLRLGYLAGTSASISYNDSAVAFDTLCNGEAGYY